MISVVGFFKYQNLLLLVVQDRVLLRPLDMKVLCSAQEDICLGFLGGSNKLFAGSPSHFDLPVEGA